MESEWQALYLVSLGETLVLSKTVVIFSLLHDDHFARPARELMPQAHFCRRNTRERPRETVPETHFEVSPFVVRAVLGEILTFVGVSLSSLCACRILWGPRKVLSRCALLGVFTWRSWILVNICRSLHDLVDCRGPCEKILCRSCWNIFGDSCLKILKMACIWGACMKAFALPLL